jgi:hypothetical protein
VTVKYISWDIEANKLPFNVLYAVHVGCTTGEIHGITSVIIKYEPPFALQEISFFHVIHNHGYDSMPLDATLIKSNSFHKFTTQFPTTQFNIILPTS